MGSLLNCGCRYDGSFMQMNSDSPMPFLGLQLSVRNENRSLKEPDQVRSFNSQPGAATALAVYPDFASNDAHSHLLHEVVNEPATQVSVSRNTGLVPASSSSEFRGRVRYSFTASQTVPDVSADEVTLRVNSF